MTPQQRKEKKRQYRNEENNLLRTVFLFNLLPVRERAVFVKRLPLTRSISCYVLIQTPTDSPRGYVWGIYHMEWYWADPTWPQSSIIHTKYTCLNSNYPIRRGKQHIMINRSPNMFEFVFDHEKDAVVVTKEWAFEHSFMDLL